MGNNISLIALLSFATLLPFLIASGTCFIKFSIVFVIVRNALGLQQIPSNMTLNGIALLLSAFVMMPIAQQGYSYYQQRNLELNSVVAVTQFVDQGLGGYRSYLQRYADPELTEFFQRIEEQRTGADEPASSEATPSLLSLLPAYALSEIKSAFRIGFFIYLPFVVVDLVVSSILLSLGMMMMSPVTISVPIKLILFVSMDGWSLLAKGLVLQYLDIPR
jgi:type III secretion apparatus YscR/HrcR family protein